MNKFLVQPNKTSMIVTRPKRKNKDEQNESINVDGVVINESSHFTMLGYKVDNKLNNEIHGDYIIKKARKLLAPIRRLSEIVPRNTSARILKACMLTQIMYAGFLYLHITTIKSKIQKIVMQAARIILKIKISDRIRNIEILKQLNITSIQVLHQRQCLLEMIKWESKWEDIFVQVDKRTRGSIKSKFRTPGIKHATVNSFLKYMIDVWNLHGHKIRSQNLTSKKVHIKQLIK